MKTILNKFAGRLPVGRVCAAGWLKLALVTGFGLLASLAAAQPANDNFASAVLINGPSGTTSGSNVGASLEACELTSVDTVDYGVEPVANSVWYAWTAPASGTVEFDTIGSSFDTLLAVFTDNTTSLCDPSLALVTANDDIGGTNNWVVQSQVSFSAVAGTTYYISVNSSVYGQNNSGNIVLNWNSGQNTVPTISSGDFEFTSTSYTASDQESSSPHNLTLALHSLLGARVTVSRTGGFSGRVHVPYTVTAIDADQSGADTAGELVFDDYQMSADILVPVSPITPQYISITTTNAEYITNIYNYSSYNTNAVYNNPPSNPTNDLVNTSTVLSTNYNNYIIITESTTNYYSYTNHNFLPFAYFSTTNFNITTNRNIAYAPPQSIDVSLGTPYLDSLESSDLIPPTGGGGGDAFITVLSDTYYQDTSYVKSQVTNLNEKVFFNIERSTFRITEGGAAAVIYVKASQLPSANTTYTVNYAIDHNNTLIDEGLQYNTFNLQADSDYATPDKDFTDVSGGTLTWHPNDKTLYQTFTIPITKDNIVEFNEDLEIELYDPLWNDGETPTPVQLLGQVNPATLTILFDDQPAGAVDRTWNVEDSPASVPPKLTYPGTDGGVADGANGNGGTVYAAVEQPDGNLLLGGSFNLYDSNPYNHIVRVQPDGYPDFTFLASPNSGANDTINSMVLQPDGQILIGGDFTSFNSANRYHIARLNTDGTVDGAFNPGQGADGKVWAVALQSDGKIFIGGEFKTYNGTNCNYLARLNADGSLDTSFNPGSSINGPVYALAVPNAVPINISGSANGGSAENDNPVNLGLATSGTLTVDYDMQQVPDDMRVFYGGTNGVLIYDTGYIPGTGHLVIPFGPTNGVTTNLITIVMDQGGGPPGTFWSYTASVTTASTTQVYAGGAFTAVGGVACGALARLNGDGTLDTTFAVGIGTYNAKGKTDPIRALALQSDGKLLAGGSFTYVEMTAINGITCFNVDGTVDTTFGTLGAANGTYNQLTGLADTVNVITLQPDGGILIGGDFMNINQTRRVGIARLFSDGSLDTSFMDTAYNQFAGLINHFHNPDANSLSDYPQGNYRNAVNAIAVEPGTTNVIIGGSFLMVGGGSFTHSGWLSTVGSDANGNNYGIIDNGRMDVHPRSNVARLIGGGTPGPGNIAFSYGTYTVGKSDHSLYVSLTRTNGSLGIIGANFNAPLGSSGQPGIANTNDFSFDNVDPTWNTAWDLYSAITDWMVGDGTFGPNFDITLGDSQPGPGPVGGDVLNLAPAIGPGVILTVTNNGAITGNLNANLALSQPNAFDFYLGGELIPLGAALGAQQSSALTIVDPNFLPGVLSFSSPTYVVNQNAGTVTITVIRTNFTGGEVKVHYATSDGTATNGVNYTATSGTLDFPATQSTNAFTIPITAGSRTQPDKTVNLTLSTPTGGATLGQRSAVLTIVNNSYGNVHLGFASATYGANETDGNALISVNRYGSSSGTISVTVFTSNGTATNGVNYVRTTNTLTWNNNDVSPKVLSVPVIHDGQFTPNLFVNLSLTNAVLNSTNDPSGLSYGGTNAVLTITNVDFPGTVEFSAGTYSVKKYGGFALIPVIRTGGSAGTVTVGYGTMDGSAISGVNYNGTTNGLLTFTNGVVSQYFKVPIIGASANNGPLSLNLVLTNATALGSAAWPAQGSPSNAVLNIIDTDSVNEPPGGADVTYNPLAGCNGDIYALVLQTNNQLLVAGDFTMANGVPRQRIARLNADGALDSSFSLPSSTMGANDQIRALAVQSDGRILIGGYFTNFNNVANNRIARLNYDGSLDSQFNPGSGADNPVFAVAETFVNGQRKVLVAGGFNYLSGQVANGIGRLNDDGTPDTTFNPGGLGANAVIYALAVQSDGRVLIGGDFTAVNGTNASHIARLNVDGSVDLTFNNTTASDSVRALALQLDGRILVGGLFTSVNGNTNFNHIARLNPADGSTDSSFTPGLGANDAVLSIALQTDNRIVLGGEFTQCSGVTRNRITRLNPDGTVDPTINFGVGADGFVAAVVVQESSVAGYPANVPDEKIIIGGGFTHYQGGSHQHLARIYGGSISGYGAFEFSSPTYSINENGVNAVITVERTGGTSGTNVDGSGNVYVTFATTDGTAQSGVNYLGVTTNLSFAPGEVLATVVIPVLDDFVITNDLTVNLSLVPMSPAEYGDQPTAVLTIVNTDSAISFSASTYLATKFGTNVPNGFAPIYINRLGATYGTSTVVFNTSTNGANSTATPGVDYQPVTNVLVTFAPGVTVQTVFVPVINGLSDGDRTVALQLANVTGSVLYNPSNAVLTILDRTLAKGSFEFSTNNYSVNEGGGVGYSSVAITVLRTNGASGIVSVSYNTADGTAVAGAKYVPTSGLLTFGDGEMSKTFTVQVYNTATVESTEYFSVQLTNATGGAGLMDPMNATVTILNTNTGIAFVSATNTFIETLPYAVINVLRYNNTAGTTTVNYTITNGTAGAGTNFVGDNSPHQLTFNNGASEAVILVPLIYNTNATGDLQFTMGLSSPSPGVLVGTPSMTTVILQDADAGLSFTTTNTSVLKNAGTATITVICSNTNVEPVSVNYATADGTAVAGTDYTATSGTLTFSNGVGVQTFTVPIKNNSAVAGDHSFTVSLSSPTGTGRLVSPITQTVTILDSNSGLRFSSADYTVLKTGGAAVITVYRSDNTDTVSSVDFIATNGTAVNGLNFIATNGTLFFGKGTTSSSFTVPIIAPIPVQPDLTVLLELSNPTNGILLTPSAALLTIQDPSGSYVIPAGSQIVTNYTSLSDYTNGIIGSNDTVQVLFAFRDSKDHQNVTNLIATLLANSGVTPANPVTNIYGQLISGGHSVSRPFTFTAHGTNGQQIIATFALQDGANSIGTNVFGFTLGSWTSVFSNTAAIIINDTNAASPYPAVINVSRVGGSLIKATVTLNKLTHTSPSDVDALVVSPAGTNTLIMAHVGGGNSVTNVVLTFDDAATNTLSSGRLTTSTNKPSNNNYPVNPVRNFP